MTSERIAARLPGHGRAGRRRPAHAQERRHPRQAGRRPRSRATRSATRTPRSRWRALFGKVWYEGYAQARVRLAVDRRHRRLRAEVQPDAADLRHAQGHGLRAALRDPARRPRRALHLAVHAPDDQGASVKPTVEIMAALPSVVLGFLAGLWLAPRVERSSCPVLLHDRRCCRCSAPPACSSGTACPAALRDAAPAGHGGRCSSCRCSLLGALARASRSGPRSRRRSSAATSSCWLLERPGPRLRPAQLPRRRARDGLRRDPDHLHDRRGRLLERARST